MARPTALIVEDDNDIARLFDLALQQAGFAVEVLHSGRQGMERLADSTPNIVVLDLNLPSVSGIEILHYIRSEPRLAATRVIVASANPQLADYVYEQADLVLLKPISFDQLRDLGKRFG